MDNELNLEELTEVEPWYETRYSVRKFSGDELSAWSAEPVDPQLCLPSKNIFVAKDFSLKGTDPLTPCVGTVVDCTAVSCVAFCVSSCGWHVHPILLTSSCM